MTRGQYRRLNQLRQKARRGKLKPRQAALLALLEAIERRKQDARERVAAFEYAVAKDE